MRDKPRFYVFVILGVALIASCLRMLRREIACLECQTHRLAKRPESLRSNHGRCAVSISRWANGALGSSREFLRAKSTSPERHNCYRAARIARRRGSPGWGFSFPMCRMRTRLAFVP
jgi:hypothetical protein